MSNFGDTNETRIFIAKETTWNVAPTTGGKSDMPYTSESLSQNGNFSASDTIRADRQTEDLIGTGLSISGDLNLQLRAEAWNDFIASALQSQWVSAKSTSDVEAVAATQSEGAHFVMGSAAEAATFRPGMVVKAEGFTTTSNNGVKQIIRIDGDKLYTVDSLTDEAAASGQEIGGDYLENASIRSSYYIERDITNISKLFWYSGAVVDKMSLNFATDEIVTGSFSVMCGNYGAGDSSAALPLAVTPVPRAPIMNATKQLGRIMMDGELVGGTQSLSIETMNGIRERKVIGTETTAEFGNGSFQVNVSAEVFFRDEELDRKARASESLAISWTVEDQAGNAYGFYIPRAKFSESVNATVGGRDQDITSSLSLMGLADLGGTDKTLIMSKVGA